MWYCTHSSHNWFDYAHKPLVQFSRSRTEIMTTVDNPNLEFIRTERIFANDRFLPYSKKCAKP